MGIQYVISLYGKHVGDIWCLWENYTVLLDISSENEHEKPLNIHYILL